MPATLHINNPAELQQLMTTQQGAKALLLALGPIVAEHGYAFDGPIGFVHDETGTHLQFTLTQLPQEE